MRTKLSLMVFSVAVAVCINVGAQDTLLWYNPGAPDATGPDGSLLPGTPSAPSSGALVQLFRTGGSTTAPDWNFGPGNYEDTTGAGGSDVFSYFSYVGIGGSGDGVISETQFFSTVGIGGSTSIFVRVWDRPSSDSAGNLPTPQTYADLSLLALYPTAGVIQGAFYWEGVVQLANANDLGGGFYGYEIPAISDSDWTFLPVPEPGTLALAGLGVLMLAFRRLRRTFVR